VDTELLEWHERVVDRRAEGGRRETGDVDFVGEY
jgi:hypothetical protein